MKNGVAKYEWKDKVWLIQDYKAVERIVDSAEMSLKKECTIKYYLLDKDGINDFKLIEEKHLYSSKEELLKSL